MNNKQQGCKILYQQHQQALNLLALPKKRQITPPNYEVPKRRKTRNSGMHIIIILDNFHYLLSTLRWERSRCRQSHLAKQIQQSQPGILKISSSASSHSRRSIGSSWSFSVDCSDVQLKQASYSSEPFRNRSITLQWAIKRLRLVWLLHVNAKAVPRNLEANCSYPSLAFSTSHEPVKILTLNFGRKEMFKANWECYFGSPTRLDPELFVWSKTFINKNQWTLDDWVSLS